MDLAYQEGEAGLEEEYAGGKKLVMKLVGTEDGDEGETSMSQAKVEQGQLDHRCLVTNDPLAKGWALLCIYGV